RRFGRPTVGLRPPFGRPNRPSYVSLTGQLCCRAGARTPSPVRNQPLKSADQLSFGADGSISGCLRAGSRARRVRGFACPSRRRKSPIVLAAGQSTSGRSIDKRASNLRGPQVGLCLRNVTTASVIAGSVACTTVWRAELRWTSPAAPQSRYRLSHL